MAAPIMTNAAMSGTPQQPQHPTFARSLSLREALRRRSRFLFGPRQAGKTSLVHQQLPEAR